MTAGIRFCLKLFIPEKLPFHQCDLGIVLGNAIDNAIEAVKNCEPSDRTIDISMGGAKRVVCIYYLKSIKRVVEKYYGEMLIETEDHI